jgi:hypothetical protein
MAFLYLSQKGQNHGDLRSEGPSVASWQRRVGYSAGWANKGGGRGAAPPPFTLHTTDDKEAWGPGGL